MQYRVRIRHTLELLIPLPFSENVLSLASEYVKMNTYRNRNIPTLNNKELKCIHVKANNFEHRI